MAWGRLGSCVSLRGAGRGGRREHGVQLGWHWGGIGALLGQSNPGLAPLSVLGLKKISILDLNSSLFQLFVSNFQHF